MNKKLITIYFFVSFYIVHEFTRITEVIVEEEVLHFVSPHSAAVMPLQKKTTLSDLPQQIGGSHIQ